MTSPRHIRADVRALAARGESCASIARILGISKTQAWRQVSPKAINLGNTRKSVKYIDHRIAVVWNAVAVRGSRWYAWSIAALMQGDFT